MASRLGFPALWRSTICLLKSSVECLGCLGSLICGPPVSCAPPGTVHISVANPVLPLQGLGGRDGRGVHGEARGLPRVLSGRAHQEVPRVAEPDGVPQEAWIRPGVVQEIVCTPMARWNITYFLFSLKVGGL